MHLTPDWISAWARWQNLNPEAETKLKAKADEQANYLERYLIHIDAHQKICMSLSLFEWMPGIWAFASPQYAPDSSLDQALDLIQEATQWAKKHQIALECRLEAPFDHLNLDSLGWQLAHTRFEFESPVLDLPDDQGSPLVYKSLGDELSLAQIAEIMQQAAVGDPDFDPDESALDALCSYQQDASLNHASDCFQVAYLNEKVAGIVIAQNNSQNGWGRITYLAMLPQMRGQGLGQWLYRHGFAMLKAQGAKQYCGGTLSTNAPMLHLFAKLGLKPVRALQQWRMNAQELS